MPLFSITQFLSFSPKRILNLCMEEFFPPETTPAIFMGESPSFQNQLPFETNVQNTSKVMRPLLLGNIFYKKANNNVPWSRLGGSKTTDSTPDGVKRLYVPLENQNQKALISSYDWIRFANTPIYKMDVPTSHGETTRSKNHQLGVHGVGKSILPHKNKTTTYRQKTLVLRRSSAFLTNTNMKTRWSSRCIKSSTLDWRLCFFTPQIWVHSSKSMHGVKMEAQSFPKMSYQTLMTSCPENDSGLMSVEDQWHPSNFCLWIPCYSFRNHTFGFQWDLPVSQKHFSGSISSENCAPSENDNLPMSCFGALAFPWNSRLQHTW